MGHLGKEKNRVGRYVGISMHRGLFALAALAPCLAACTGAGTITYSGTMVPVSGVCDPPSRAVLALEDDVVRFSPGEGVVTIDGTRSAAGEISGVVHSVGSDHLPATRTLVARLNAGYVVGNYTTPRCRYRFRLDATSN